VPTYYAAICQNYVILTLLTSVAPACIEERSGHFWFFCTCAFLFSS